MSPIPSHFLAAAGRGDLALDAEGGIAFSWSGSETLAHQACSFLLGEKNFYGDVFPGFLARARAAAIQDPEWTARLAVLVREGFQLRRVSQCLLALLLESPGGYPAFERAFPRVVLRAQDLIDLFHLVARSGRLAVRGFPNVLRRGVAAALAAITPHEALKYRRPCGLGMRHLLRVFHPEPRTDGERAVLRFLAGRPLEAADLAAAPAFASLQALRRTAAGSPEALEIIARGDLPWETAISLAGSTRETWLAILPRLPSMALLRNLRNLARHGILQDPGSLEIVVAALTDPDRIRKSRLLPFRFLSARRAVAGVRELEDALARAVGLAVANLPRLPGRTLLAADNSGSMDSPVSHRSTIRARDIANLLAASAETICDESEAYTFASWFREVPRLPGQDVLARAEAIARVDVGGGTDADNLMAHVLERRLRFDRFIVLTDMVFHSVAQNVGWLEGQDFYSLLVRYRHEVNPELRTYVLNLAAYERFVSPADDAGVVTISGWSDAVLAYVAETSSGGGRTLAERVAAVEW